MRFKEWLLSEIHWAKLGAHADATIGINKIPVMYIRGIPSNQLDFHFELYPQQVKSEDGSVIRMVPKSKLMQMDTSFSADLGDGKYLNVNREIKKAPADQPEFDNVATWRAWKAQQRQAGVEGNLAVQTEKHEDTSIDSEATYLKLPDIWFDQARLEVLDKTTEKIWVTKEHGSLEANPLAIKALTRTDHDVNMEPFRKPDAPTVEPERPTLRPEPAREPVPMRIIR